MSNLYKFIDDITVNKVLLKDNDLTGYNSFQISNMIASSDLFIPIIQVLNNTEMSNRFHYLYLKSIMPQRKIYCTFLKTDKKYNEEIYAICKYYECGTRDAEIYRKRLPENKIKEIIDIVENGK